MIFIGDVHGKFDQYHRIIEKCDESIQVGDFGIGFPHYKHVNIKGNHRFLRGNHDNPEVCRKHPNYLGDWGTIFGKKLFFISGAWSIDAKWRTVGSTWWEDEQINESEYPYIVKKYENMLPEIFVSHDGPTDAIFQILGSHKEIIKTRTSNLLQILFDIHKPKLWVFGHYHVPLDVVIKDTRFVCLPELKTLEVKL